MLFLPHPLSARPGACLFQPSQTDINRQRFSENDILKWEWDNIYSWGKWREGERVCVWDREREREV